MELTEVGRENTFSTHKYDRQRLLLFIISGFLFCESNYGSRHPIQAHFPQTLEK